MLTAAMALIAVAVGVPAGFVGTTWLLDGKAQVGPLQAAFVVEPSIPKKPLARVGSDERKRGKLMCWGGGPSSMIAATSEVLNYSVEDGYACGILPTSHKLDCWGAPRSWNEFHISNRQSPKGVPARAVTLGIAAACYAKAEGGVACWGILDSGRLEPPKDLTDGRKFRRFALGGRAICGVTVENEALCWGWPTEMTGWQDLLPAGDIGNVVFDEMGAHICWSQLSDNQVVCHSTSNESQEVVRYQAQSTVVELVSGGGVIGCAIEESGRATCFDRSSQTLIGEDIVDMVVGWGVFCRLHKSGRVDCDANVGGAKPEMVKYNPGNTLPSGIRFRSIEGSGLTVCGVRE